MDQACLKNISRKKVFTGKKKSKSLKVVDSIVDVQYPCLIAAKTCNNSQAMNHLKIHWKRIENGSKRGWMFLGAVRAAPKLTEAHLKPCPHTYIPKDYFISLLFWSNKLSAARILHHFLFPSSNPQPKMLAHVEAHGHVIGDIFKAFIAVFFLWMSSCICCCSALAIPGPKKTSQKASHQLPKWYHQAIHQAIHNWCFDMFLAFFSCVFDV